MSNQLLDAAIQALAQCVATRVSQDNDGEFHVALNPLSERAWHKADAEAMRVLAAAGRMKLRIDNEHQVCGRWA